MNKPQNVRRPRGRGPKRGPGGNPGGNRGGMSSRGNPRQLLDKYKTLAREAMQSGERVLAEYYFQHADHYQRVLNERSGVQNGSDDEVEEDEDDEDFSPPREERSRRSRSERAAEADLAERPQPRLADTGNGVAASSADVPVRNGAPAEATGDGAPTPAAEPRPRRRRRPLPARPAGDGPRDEGDGPV